MSRQIRLLTLVILTLFIGAPVFAASHREAPLIANDPAADITDFYMFRSWQDSGKAILIMNVIPRSLGIKDYYILGAYADFLLDQGRAQEVVTLLQHETRADGLLLRLTLAEQALHLSASKDHTAELAARFATGRERGTNVHVREEARFTLALLHDPQAALNLAQANWEIQKEPWDGRLLLESALAAGSRKTARPVIDWLNTNLVEDRTLQQLVAQFPEEQS